LWITEKAGGECEQKKERKIRKQEERTGSRYGCTGCDRLPAGQRPLPTHPTSAAELWKKKERETGRKG